MGTIEGTIVALFLERGNAAVWTIHLDSKLLAAVYSVRFQVRQIDMKKQIRVR